MAAWALVASGIFAALIWGAGAAGTSMRSRELVLGATYWTGMSGLHVVDLERDLSVPLVLGVRGNVALSSSEVIAFTEPSGSLYTMDLRDRNQQLVWQSNARSFAFQEMAWSPDGTTLAFVVSDINGGGQTQSIHLATGETVRNLMPDSDYESINSIAWSPDGAQIAFTVQGFTLSAVLMVIDIESGAIRQLSPEGLPSAEAQWSPDGTQISFLGSNASNIDVFIMNSDGSNVRNLTANMWRDRLSLWSPDGTQIAFVTCEVHRCLLYRTNVDSSGGRMLKEYDRILILNAAWSPDGTQIALELQGTYATLQRIGIVNVDGSGTQTLRSPDYVGYAPAWMP